MHRAPLTRHVRRCKADFVRLVPFDKLTRLKADELKIALLEGGLPRAKLVALMDLLQTRRDQTHDARLEAALDEVETRAAVELAKFS